MEENHEDPGDEAPGWDAIDEAMCRLYGSAEPRHVGYMPPAAFSANLQGRSAHAADGHRHYVSYGLSELYVAEPDTGTPAPLTPTEGARAGTALSR